MDEYIIYNNDYNVIICRQHGFAIPPDWIRRHFQDSHKGIPLETRKEMIEYSKSLELCQPTQVVLPDSIMPINGLTIIDGYKCCYEPCVKLSSTVKSMEKHCGSAHGWVAAHGIRWREQKLQTFFASQNRK